MREEVDSAAKFVANLLKCRNGFTNSELEKFHQTFFMIMCSHYQDHWFPEKPFKGSGFRCIRINHNMDPIIARAGSGAGLSEVTLQECLPKEITIWVDPKEVSYRFGEDGTIGIIYDESTSQRTQSFSSSDSECCSDDDNRGSPMIMDQPHVFTGSPQNTENFLMACRDQLRFYRPETSSSSEAPVNYEYYSTFVAS